MYKELSGRNADYFPEKDLEDEGIEQGPLNKSPATFQLEKLLISILMGEEMNFSYSEEWGLTVIAGGDKEYNVSLLLEYAELGHLILKEADEKDIENSYIELLKSGPIKWRPQLPGESQKFPTEKEFRERDQEGNFKKVSYPEMLAINIYSGDRYEEINALLRGGMEYVARMVEEDNDSIKLSLLTACLSGIGLHQTHIDTDIPTESFRLERELPHNVIRQREEAVRSKGATYDAGFTSTSVGGEVDWELEIKAHVKFRKLCGKYIESIARYSDEREFLIPPTQMRWVWMDVMEDVQSEKKGVYFLAYPVRSPAFQKSPLTIDNYDKFVQASLDRAEILIEKLGNIEEAKIARYRDMIEDIIAFNKALTLSTLNSKISLVNKHGIMLDKIEELIKYPEKVKKEQLFFNAVKNGETDKVQELLIQDKDLVNAKDEEGKTALMYTVMQDNIDMLELLLSKGANPNEQEGVFSKTALMLASQKHNYKIVRILLKYDADPNLTNEDEQTALMLSLTSAKATTNEPVIESANMFVMDEFEVLDSRSKGSNPGGLYRGNSSGYRYYLKFPAQKPGVNKDKIDVISRNEVLAAKLYELAGVKVPNISLVKTADGHLGIASKIEETFKTVQEIDSDKNIKKVDWPNLPGIKEGFAADAWLANWDVIGVDFDNIGSYFNQTTNKFEAFRVDTGGALLYRAQGEPKGEFFEEIVGEVDSLRGKSLLAKSNDASKAFFSSITDDQIANGVQKIANIPQASIRALVKEYGPEDESEKEALLIKLIARQKYLIQRFGIIPKITLGDEELNVIRLLLKSGANLNIDSRESLRFIMFAAIKNYSDIVLEILKQDGDDVMELLRAEDENGNTPLMLAVINNDIILVSEILKQAGDGVMELLRAKNKDGNTPLMFAVINNDLFLVSGILKQAGDNVMELLMAKNKDGNTPLNLANGLYFVFEMLKRAGDNAMRLLRRGEDRNGNTLLMHAVIKNYPDIVSEMLELAGDDVMELLMAKNKDGNTPLMLAATKNYPDIVSEMLELAGDDAVELLKAEVKEGKTALDHIIEKSRPEIIRQILFFAIDKDPSSAKEILAKAKGSLADFLFQIQDNDGATPLIIAAKKGNLEIIEEILDKLDLEEINFVDLKGRDALTIAQKNGYEDVVIAISSRKEALDKLDNLLSDTSDEKQPKWIRSSKGEAEENYTEIKIPDY